MVSKKIVTKKVVAKPKKLSVEKSAEKKTVVKKVVARPAPKTIMKREPAAPKEASPKTAESLALPKERRILTAEGWKRARAAK